MEFDESLLEDGFVGIKVKEGQSIHIDGTSIEVYIRKASGVGGKTVQLLVRAPRCISVRRGDATESVKARPA